MKFEISKSINKILKTIMEHLNKIPAKFIRGGTSKGLYFNSSSLPQINSERDGIILRIMGSPDPNGLQIDGMGGGISSTSKIALISKRIINGLSFLNYNFGQVSMKESKIDWSGNCGNLASGLFEFARLEKDYEDCFESLKLSENNKYFHKLRVWQENKKHEMFIWGNLNAEKNEQNLVKISGIQRPYPPLFVEFKNIIPENANLFPTGNVVDKLELSQNDSIEVTLLSGANPLVLIRPEVLNLKGQEIPKDINYEAIKEKLNLICLMAAKHMKIEITDALRVAWISSPASYTDSSGNFIEEKSVDILSRITTNNRVHHAHTGTGAINIAVACMIKGTLANSCLKNQGKGKELEKRENEIRIGHPGGTMTCEADVEFDENKKKWEIKRAGFIRTARLLMDGFVYV